MVAVAMTIVVFLAVAERRLLTHRVRKLVQRDCIFEMEADARSLASVKFPLYEKGLSRKEQILEVQHDVDDSMSHLKTLSSKTLRFLLRSFRDQPKTMTDTINAVIPIWLFRDQAKWRDINAEVRNAVVFKNVRLGGNSECCAMLDKLRVADEVFKHETFESLNEKDHAWAERILGFLIYRGTARYPVPVAIVEFLRDNPDGLNHMMDYSQDRGIKLNEIDIPTLKEYLNADAMPLRDGML